MGRVRSPKRRVRDDDFILGYRRISSDILGYPRIILGYPRIVFLLAEALQGVSAQMSFVFFLIVGHYHFVGAYAGATACLRGHSGSLGGHKL